MGITLPEALLLAFFLETLFYGVFLTLYWLTLVILLKKCGIQRDLFIPVATLLLCIATAHLIIDLVRALEAFIFSVYAIGANAYYSNLASPLELAKTALYITQPTIADAVLVWRCYVLNDRSLLVGIPGCIVLLTNGAIGYYVVWSLSQAGMGSTVYTTVPGLISTFYILTMLISVICTSLISWRIYRSRHSKSDGPAAFLPILIRRRRKWHFICYQRPCAPSSIRDGIKWPIPCDGHRPSYCGDRILSYHPASTLPYR
ncbi:hypothetical protein EDD22DRAFT_547367 [Suillus occidentalis]|nr:hypothetical protein EDD22DRAFT_547367 [Suillus occidentalis]